MCVFFVYECRNNLRIVAPDSDLRQGIRCRLENVVGVRFAGFPLWGGWFESALAREVGFWAGEVTPQRDPNRDIRHEVLSAGLCRRLYDGTFPCLCRSGVVNASGEFASPHVSGEGFGPWLAFRLGKDLECDGLHLS